MAAPVVFNEGAQDLLLLAAVDGPLQFRLIPGSVEHRLQQFVQEPLALGAALPSGLIAIAGGRPHPRPTTARTLAFGGARGRQWPIFILAEVFGIFAAHR
jgi:hypothetical protein